MKSALFTATIFVLFYFPAVVNTPAQRAEQKFSLVKIERFDWYAESEIPEPQRIKSYYPNKFPRGESANFPAENPSSPKTSEQFIYRVSVRNLSEKIIASVVWRYEFVNPLTGETAASLEFESRARIKPGRRKTLYAESSLLPTSVVDVKLLLLNKDQPFLESVTIKSLAFEDSPKRNGLNQTKKAGY